MTVYIEKPALNLREELASLRNQGGYQEQQFYFDGLVTNGDFATDTNWTKATGWTISGGTANSDGTSSSIYQAGFTTGAFYSVTFTVTSISSGSFRLNMGAGILGASRTSAGTYTEILASGDGLTRILSSSGIGSIDNVSAFNSDGTKVIHTMPKGWKPKDFFEDGLLQREGAANDYEVIYDGFDYVIKPTVSPSITTQTCVIGVKA